MKSQFTDKIQLEKQIFNKSDTYTLVGLAISPEFRGNIIIFQLLKEFEKYVWAKKFKAIRLTVYKFNNSVIQLYKYLKWELYFQDKDTLRFIKINN